MRRSICQVEPTSAKAGDTGNWKFTFTPANDLPKGTHLKFDLLSSARPFDWQIPQTNPKEKSNLIWAELSDGKPIKPTQSSKEEISQFEFTLPSELKAGENFTIWIGTPLKSIEKNGNACQQNIQRRRPFNIYIDPKGKGDYKEKETFYLDVRGNILQNLRIITPSFVARNKRFDVIVRFEDKYGNLTNNAPEGTLVELSYQHLRENLSWKLFVPETGFITLPNLYFNEPGIYKIKLKNLLTNDIYFSPPIKCFAETKLSLFWGLLHGESERVDSGENIESCLRYFRDEKALQFFATSSFDTEDETSNDTWKTITHHIAEFNESDRFTSFLGLQWVGEPSEEGVRQFIYSKDSKPILRKKDIKHNSLKKIYKTYQTKDLLSIPCSTMDKKNSYDFKEFAPAFERVVEIYNAWGSSECTEKEGNLRPIKKTGKKTSDTAPEGSIQKALLNNCRFGFVAGGFDDRGIYSEFYDIDQMQYSPGLTAIISTGHSRDELFDALYKRSCFATTGERIIVGLEIAGQPMGSELNTTAKPGLLYNRHITGYVSGTTDLQEIVIIRNGKTFKTFHPQGEVFDFALDDSELLSTVVIPSSTDKTPFVYYYIRAIQKDGHIAWSSPIWVDLTTQAAPVKVKEKKNGK